MSCEACTQAEASPWLCGSFRVGCASCEARALAKDPRGSQALKDALLGHPGEIQALMRQMWPSDEAYRIGRIEVYRWARLIEEAKGTGAIEWKQSP